MKTIYTNCLQVLVYFFLLIQFVATASAEDTIVSKETIYKDVIIDGADSYYYGKNVISNLPRADVVWLLDTILSNKENDRSCKFWGFVINFYYPEILSSVKVKLKSKLYLDSTTIMKMIASTPDWHTGDLSSWRKSNDIYYMANLVLDYPLGEPIIKYLFVNYNLTNYSHYLSLETLLIEMYERKDFASSKPLLLYVVGKYSMTWYNRYRAPLTQPLEVINKDLFDIRIIEANSDQDLITFASKINNQSSGKLISVLFLAGHGDPRAILFDKGKGIGESGFLDLSDKSILENFRPYIDLGKLDVVLFSCSTAKGSEDKLTIAELIAKTLQARVYAPDESIDEIRSIGYAGEKAEIVSVSYFTENQEELKTVIFDYRTGSWSGQIILSNLRASPNPFSNFVKISFFMTSILHDYSEEFNWQVTIFDLSGRQITKLPLKKNDNKLEAYWNGLTSNGKNCRTGMYYAYVPFSHDLLKIIKK